MTELRVYDLIKKKALITRESAEPIRQALSNVDLVSTGKIILDFSGVEAVTPSFVDELLAIVEGARSRSKSGQLELLVVNPPTRLSSKFFAVARAHGVEIREVDSSWRVTGNPPRG